MPSKVPDLDKTLLFLHREILNYSYLLFLFTHKTEKLPFQNSVQRDNNNCWVPLCGTILLSLKPVSALSRPLAMTRPMTWNSTPFGGSQVRGGQSGCQEPQPAECTIKVVKKKTTKNSWHKSRTAAAPFTNCSWCKQKVLEILSPKIKFSQSVGTYLGFSEMCQPRGLGEGGAGAFTPEDPIPLLGMTRHHALSSGDAVRLESYAHSATPAHSCSKLIFGPPYGTWDLQLGHRGSSLLTRDRTWSPHTESTES